MQLSRRRPGRLPVVRRLARLGRDTSGLALIEFAFAMPLLLAVGFAGIELADLAIDNLAVSHAAIDLADNVARMGQQSTSTGYQVLTESNIDDAIQALRLERSDLTTNGRVTISSIEARTDANGVTTQFLHWQRCVGKLTGAESSAIVAAGASAPGATKAPYDDSGITVAGVGSPMLTAPHDSGLMFVEVNYTRSSVFASIPLLKGLLASSRNLHYVSAMIVRQTRSTYDSIDNSAQVTKMTCDKQTV